MCTLSKSLPLSEILQRYQTIRPTMLNTIYTDNYNKSVSTNTEYNLTSKYQGINRMTAKLTKIIQNVSQLEKENVQVSKNTEIKRLESHNADLKSQNEQLKRITKSLQELSQNRNSSSDVDGPIRYANSNNNAIIEYSKIVILSFGLRFLINLS